MNFRFAAAAAAALVAAGGLTTGAFAAAPTTVCAAPLTCDFTSLVDAVAAAADGDTIEVQGPLSVAQQITVGDGVTVTGAPGATITQTATAITFLLNDGATLSNLTITSDTPKAREFVQVGGDDVTISGNTIYGPAQALPMSGWVGNRGFVTQGSITGLTVTDNTFHSMRSGAYLNPNGTGLISDNTLYNTKGDFLIDNANFTFIGNQAGDPAQPSEWGFVIFGTTQADRYDAAALSQANNLMTAWDQRDGSTYVVPTDADDCKDGAFAGRTPSFKNQGQCMQFLNTGKL